MIEPAPPLAIDLNAVEARGLALGLRRAWRLRLPAAHLGPWQQAFAAAGHHLAVSEQRFALTQGGSLAASDRPDAVHLVVIALAKAVAEACLADELANAARIEGDDPARLARTVAAHRRLGRAYGYPSCCVDAFVDGWMAAIAGSSPALAENALLILRAHRRSQAWHPLLRAFGGALGEQTSSPLRHLPCRFDCPDSLALARQLLADLRVRAPAQAQRYDRAVPMALWLHADGRLSPASAPAPAAPSGPATAEIRRLPVLLPFGG